jgi:hypothetical protein
MHTTTTTCQARTPEGKLRQRVWRLSRELNLCLEAQRNVMASLTGDRYARNLSLGQLEVVVAFLEAEVANKRPVYSTDDYSDEACLDLLGVAA